MENLSSILGLLEENPPIRKKNPKNPNTRSIFTTRKNIRHERYEYFSGKADPDVYIQNPFPKKIRDKDTMTKYLDADVKLSNASLKIEYYDTMLTYLESILKVVQNRTFQIKNAIEFMRFNSGLG